MLKRNPSALWTELGSAVAILNITSGRYFEIQGTGTDLWRWLEQPCDIESLIARLIIKYSVEPEQAHRDILVFLNQLRSNELLEDATASSF